MKVRILGCGTSLGRAAGRQRLGRVRSATSRATAAAASRSWSPTARPGSWSTPGPTCASNCSTPTSSDVDGGDLDPRPCRSLPRHRRSPAALPCPRAAGGRLCPPGDAGELLKRRFAYAFDGQGRLSGGRRRPSASRSYRIWAASRSGPSTSPTATSPAPACASTRAAFRSAIPPISTMMTDEMAMLFAGLDLWIVDALRRRPHPTHPHLAHTLDWIARLRPKRAMLTHMDNSMDYRTLCAELPAGGRAGL